MKRLVLGFMFLFLASAGTAQTETDWRALLTTSGSKVVAVDGATKIDIGMAKTLHERGLSFIDTRGSYDWKKGHIPGAYDLPYPTEAALTEIVGKNDELVFYCDCDVGSANCNRSPHQAAIAVASGFQNVYYFTNSNEWSAEGYAIEKAE